MDSQCHDLRGQSSEITVLAVDTPNIGNTVQRLTSQSAQRDDVSSISEELNDDAPTRNRSRSHVYSSSEKGPQILEFESRTPERPGFCPIQGNRGLLMRIKNLAHEWWLLEIVALVSVL